MGLGGLRTVWVSAIVYRLFTDLTDRSLFFPLCSPFESSSSFLLSCHCCIDLDLAGLPTLRYPPHSSLFFSCFTLEYSYIFIYLQPRTPSIYVDTYLGIRPLLASAVSSASRLDIVELLSTRRLWTVATPARASSPVGPASREITTTCVLSSAALSPET